MDPYFSEPESYDDPFNFNIKYVHETTSAKAQRPSPRFYL